jgi:hypothetical protein
LFATASILYHRYIYAEEEIPLRNDVWSIGMASLLLASKLHDIPITVECIIHTCCIIYRKRVLCPNYYHLDISENKLRHDPDVQRINQRIPQSWKQLSFYALLEKVDDTSFIHTLLSTRGIIYKSWYDSIVETECLILKRLGYRIHWIPDFHVYQYVEAFCSRIRLIPKVDDKKKKKKSTDNQHQQQQEQDHSVLLSQFTETTYEYCHKAMQMYLCIQYIPQIICCGAICCSARELHYDLASIDDQDTTNNNSAIGTNLTNDWWNNLWDYSMDNLLTIQNDINKVYSMIWDLSDDSDYMIGNNFFFIMPELETYRTYHRHLNIPGTTTWIALIDGDKGMISKCMEQRY